jgi:hypothetical protein
MNAEILEHFENKNLNAIMVHPKHYEELMRFENPTKLELFLDGFHNFWNCLDCYNDGDDWGYDEFWEGLSLGWYMEYIYPYDDAFNLTISPERKLRLDQKPQVIYVSEEAYDVLLEAINKPPKPSQGLIDLMNRKTPWEREND